MLQYWRVFFLTTVIMGVGAFQLYGIFSNAGYEPQQPIPFSHALHAGVMKMECLYCHSTAEKSAHASVPPVELCMGCHSIVKTNSPYIQKLTEYYEKGIPVPWVRIHKLPDHAYFSHRWHVAAGVACQTCHGPIQNMAVVKQWTKLEMGACMECHRQDTYVANIDHPPTYHEAPITNVERTEAATIVAASSISSPDWVSTNSEFSKYHGANLSANDKNVILARMKSYRDDIYQHGRGTQLRGKNASIECSTCHY